MKNLNKNDKMNLFTKQKQTQKVRDCTYVYQGCKSDGED